MDQDIAKVARDGFKIAQDGSKCRKMAQDGPDMASRWPSAHRWIWMCAVLPPADRCFEMWIALPPAARRCIEMRRDVSTALPDGEAREKRAERR